MTSSRTPPDDIVDDVGVSDHGVGVGDRLSVHNDAEHHVGVVQEVHVLKPGVANAVHGREDGTLAVDEQPRRTDQPEQRSDQDQTAPSLPPVMENPTASDAGQRQDQEPAETIDHVDHRKPGRRLSSDDILQRSAERRQPGDSHGRDRGDHDLPMSHCILQYS